MARLIRRDFRPRPASLTVLPFVADVKIAPRRKRRNSWNVPQTDDSAVACATGRQYACDLLQFLKDNPFWVGSNVFGLLVEDMAAHPSGTAMHGYEVGFWSALEVFLYRAMARDNHWDVIQAVQDREDAFFAMTSRADPAAGEQRGGHDGR